MGKSVFVTVGTTSFDELISCVSTERCTSILKELGYNRMILQIGRGTVEPEPYCTPNFTMDVFRYKDSLVQDIRNADLVISHAGAGSCLETLEEKKHLIVVINEKLMSNHQLELANQLHKDGHLYYCTCSTLGNTLKSMDLSSLKVFPPGQPEKFAEFLDKAVGTVHESEPKNRKSEGLFHLLKISEKFLCHPVILSGYLKGAEAAAYTRVAVCCSAAWGSGTLAAMHKGWKKYFGQKSLNEVTMDEYLGSLGLYRKLTAKDASCLFRTVSEQVDQSSLRCAILEDILNKWLLYVEGPFEKYLERLEDPKESAGQLEITALSLIFNQNFILYKSPGKPPTYATDLNCDGKIMLCCSTNGHYDSVFTKNFQTTAAICQAVLYECLYRDVFGVDERELIAAVELFRSGTKKNRNSASTGSEDANFDCISEHNKALTDIRTEEWDKKGGEISAEEKSKGTAEEVKTTENPNKMPFPYKVLKALDPEIYRNVEFDVWLDSRKELQKTEYMVFAGRQYCLGDKCQVRLEPGGRYYNAHIQEVGHDSNSVTVFLEELAEKHIVPLAHLKPVTQVIPVPAWNSSTNRKSASYQKIPAGYNSDLELDLKSRKRLFKKASANITSYEHFQPLQSPRRQSRGFGISKSSPRYINRHAIINPEIPFYHSPGKRCYQNFDNYTYRTRSYTRSRRQMPCVNKECQFGYVSDRDDEQRGLDDSITYYEIEEGDDANFPTLPVGVNIELNQTSTIVPATGFWVARSSPNPIGHGKPNLNSSEDEIDEPSDNGEYHGDFIYTPDGAFESSSLYSVTESAQNLSIQDDMARAVPSQDDISSYKYSEQVTSVISTSCVNATPATVISSSPSVPSTVTSTVLPQTAVQPMIMSQPPTGRPAPPGSGEMGDCTGPLPPPPYSCDPNGNDLPRDTKVLQYYFNLGLQCYHQSFWHSMVYVQPVPTPPHIESYQSFPESVPVVDQSVITVCNENRPQTLESSGPFPNVDSLPPSPGPVYYPFMPDPYNQPPLPGFDSCVPFVPTYHYVGPWHPISPPYSSSPRIHNTVNPGHIHQVSYLAAPTPPAHFVPQTI
ncbi:UDP-N-acetylglucosamine transferase subunit ALG13 [Lithobates pipiens]